MEKTIEFTEQTLVEPFVSAHTPVVAELEFLLAKDPELKVALEVSLIAACESARKTLDPNLYAAINDEFQGNGWPKTIGQYLDYLDLYVRLVPNEKDDPNYPNAWKSNGERNGYNQKVYDLLCQFYWLVDQKAPGTDISLQSFDLFAKWLVDFAVAWGKFLDKPESLTPESLHSFKYDVMYNYWLYADHQSSWTTFNDFFSREFNHAAPGTGITPLRPIVAPEDNTVIVAPADCTYKREYRINDEGDVVGIEGELEKIVLKKTHSIGNVQELLDNSSYAADFYGGTFVHYFLSPFDYHRFHTPVSGQILEIRDIQGKVYLNVKLTDDGQWDAPDGAGDGYEFTQARGLVVMDAGEPVGKVAILPIGMCQVSGVCMNKDLEGKTVVKGQEFGHFKFGGSDIIMVFQKKVQDLYMFKRDPKHVPIHFQYGQPAVLSVK